MRQKPLLDQLASLIAEGPAKTQHQLQAALAKMGIAVNQSTVSRALRRIGAVKSLNASGDAVYRLPSQAHHIGHNLSIKSLVENISGNEQLILIQTRSGCGNVVAQLLDEQNFAELLGTVAGDNTILVIPKSIRYRPALEKKLREFFE
jgi:transcriptional regulator of arginine metabolism